MGGPSNDKGELLLRLEGGESVEAVAASAGMPVDELRGWRSAVVQAAERRRRQKNRTLRHDVNDLVGIVLAQAIRGLRPEDAADEEKNSGGDGRTFAWLRWANAYWVAIAGLAAFVLWLWNRSVKLAVAEQEVDMLKGVASLQKDLGSTLSQFNGSMKSYGEELKARNAQLKDEIAVQQAALRNSNVERAEAEEKGRQADQKLQVAIQTLKQVKPSNGDAGHVERVLSTLQAPTPAPASSGGPRLTNLEIGGDAVGALRGQFCVRSTFRGAFAYCTANTQAECEQQLASLPSATHFCVANPRTFSCYAWKPKDLDRAIASCYGSSAECEAGRRGILGLQNASEVGSSCQPWSTP